ncbi:hypothetical protein BHM03_00012172 [Ensete ventricosum]|nr:hypothetical protein BHM03_00012172 [Ensete ventricosum]
MIWLNRYIPVNTSVPCYWPVTVRYRSVPHGTLVCIGDSKRKEKRRGEAEEEGGKRKNKRKQKEEEEGGTRKLKRKEEEDKERRGGIEGRDRGRRRGDGGGRGGSHLNYVDSEQGLPFHTVPTFQAQIGTVCLGEKPVRCSFSPRSLKILPTRRREACKRWIKIGKQCWISRFSLFFSLFFSFFFSLFFFSLG